MNVCRLLTVLLFFSLGMTSTSIAQSISGSYMIPNSSSFLGITEVIGSENKLVAYINGITIRNGAIRHPIAMEGSYRKVQQGNHGEELYILSLQGSGSWTDSGGQDYPISISLSGFITHSQPENLTSQYAAAFEFAGNAEGVIGGLLGWSKDDVLFYGGNYFVQNQYGSKSYLDACGSASCDPGITVYDVSTSSVSNRGNYGTGTWKIMSQGNTKKNGTRVAIGDLVYLQNQYSGKTYLDSCGGATCDPGITKYNVTTANQPNRGNHNTGTWKILSKGNVKPPSTAVTTQDAIYLQNQYGSKTYLDTCGGDSCSSGITKYDVTTANQANRGNHNTGTWIFLDAN